MSQLTKFTASSGPGSGTVTSISAGEGITLTPNPITTTGTVALTIPVTIADGGTNATSMSVTDGTVYFNGTSLVTTATGTSGWVLTSGGPGVAPAYAVLPSSSISITGDSGGALTGTAFTFTGGATGLTFSGAGTTETLTGTLVVSNGGSGAATFTAHGVLLGEGTSPFGVTAAGTTGQVLTGVTGADPVWASPAASSISITGDSGGALTGNAFTFTGGTTGLTFAGAGSTETLGGTLVVSNGGTGRATLTNHGLLVGAGTSAITQLANATNGQIPIGSTGADPVLATITAGTNIIITNGAGTITIAADTQSASFNYTAVNTSPYVVLTTDYYISVDCSGGPITINLPNLPATGRAFVIKDRTGSAATNNITITTVGGLINIDAAATYVMNTAYEAVSLIFGGTNYEVY